MNPLHLYIHVPFCETRCSYCNFYSTTNAGQMDAFVRAVQRELFKWKNKLPKDTVLPTVYFGGGTPGYLGEARIAFLMKAVRSAFSIDPNAEVTLETNPGIPLSFSSLKQAGINRISLGMQTAVPKEASVLNRRHTNDDVKAAVEQAKAAGIFNISVDLILGIPFQTARSLEKSLAFLLGLSVPHISAYLLKLEEGTPLFKRKEDYSFPSEDEVAEYYLQAAGRLEAAGLLQYEISNFSKPGMESLHNKAYWQGKSYLGLGPSAHSYWKGRRFYYADSLKDFLSSSEKPDFRVKEEGVGGEIGETLLLRLRLREGIVKSEMEKMFLGFAPQWERLRENARPLERAGLCHVLPDRIFLSKEGFLLSNLCTLRLLEGVCSF